MTMRKLFAAGAAVLALSAALHCEEPLVPRRVYFQPPEEAGLEGLSPEQRSLLMNFPYFLSAEIASRKPFIQVPEDAEADTIVKSGFRRIQDGVEAFAEVSDKGLPVRDARLVFVPGTTTLDRYAARIAELAAELLPFFADVAPQVSVERMQQEERLSRVVKEVSFEDALDTRHQLTLWGGGMLQAMRFGDGDSGSAGMDTLGFNKIHFMIDYTTYVSSNFGWVLSAYFDRNSNLVFGTYDTVVDNDRSIDHECSSENTYAMVGIGVSYRTLGRLSGEFSTILYLGNLSVKANEDIQYYFRSDSYSNYDRVWQLAAGESSSFFVSLWAIQPGIGFSFTDKVALRVRWNFCVDPSAMTGGDTSLAPFSRTNNMMLSNIGEIGFSVRY